MTWTPYSTPLLSVLVEVFRLFGKVEASGGLVFILGSVGGGVGLTTRWQ